MSTRLSAMLLENFKNLSNTKEECYQRKKGPSKIPHPKGYKGQENRIPFRKKNYKNLENDDLLEFESDGCCSTKGRTCAESDFLNTVVLRMC